MNCCIVARVATQNATKEQEPERSMTLSALNTVSMQQLSSTTTSDVGG